jgi:hypothetical protein
MKNTTSLKRVLGAAAALAVIALAVACNQVENKSQSASLLTVQSILGHDRFGGESTFLESDVIIQDAATGGSSWSADSATARLTVSTLDPNPLLGVSQYNDVQVTRYVVTYSRVDGKNQPGVDVPYSFEGSLSRLIRVGSTENVDFIIVRDVAKQEAPLMNLKGSFMGEVLNITARVDFYGHDLANKTVTATGYLPIYFANFVDR